MDNTPWGFPLIFGSSECHWPVQICERTYTNKRKYSKPDRLPSNNIIDIVESFGRGLCGGIERFGRK